MDKITKSFLAEFQTTQGLVALDEDDAFERFANYCVITQEFSDTFDIEDVSTGSGSDTGIDGVAVIANGALLTDPDEVDGLVARNGYLDVRFVFCQAKTSSSFSAADVGTFAFGVADFFADSPRLPRNDRITAAAELQQAIFQRGTFFSRGKPVCRLYYVTTGRWQSDSNVLARLHAAEQDLSDTQLFSEVKCVPVDADKVQDFYQQTKNKIRGEFVFSSRAVMPDMQGISQAYIGVIPASEYLKLITDDVGNIRLSLFYDNVRAFQDYNDVNKDIKETLTSDIRDRFAVLNNGVTMVAKSLQAVGNRFYIEDYQIVNGCQTSHVLYDQRNLLKETVHVPLKVIVCDDDQIVNAIITGTNRQTEVKREQLFALSDFQKSLELFFQTFTDKQRLFYERRSRQYSSTPGIERVRIITLSQQIRAFASMFLDEPHRASRYYSELLGLVGDEIFGAEHRLEPYYTSAYALYRLEFLFRNSQLGQRYRPARYHLLMVLRHQVAGAGKPQMNAKKMQAYCQSILSVLWDDEAASEGFERAAKVIDQVTGLGEIDRDKAKTQSFTDSVLAALAL